MTDTHAHLDACAEPAEVIVARARAAGVGRIVSVGSGIDSCRETLAIAAREHGVFAALGSTRTRPETTTPRASTSSASCSPTSGPSRSARRGSTSTATTRPHDLQRELFARQLDLAAELGKAVVVHTRAASSETAQMLEGFAGTVVLHCFSAPELLPVALERGYYVSFAGNVTYPSAEDLREAARQVPGDRLLVETDSPYLSPQPRRGRPNEPANVVHTAAALAEARGEDADELGALLDANATAAFSLA